MHCMRPSMVVDAVQQRSDKHQRQILVGMKEERTGGIDNVLGEVRVCHNRNLKKNSRNLAEKGARIGEIHQDQWLWLKMNENIVRSERER